MRTRTPLSLLTAGLLASSPAAASAVGSPPASPAPASSAAPAATRTAAAAVELPTPTSTSGVHVRSRTGALAQVTGVRTGRHASFDRLVIDLEGAMPGYDVRYVPEVTTDGSGAPLPLAGEAFLAVDLVTAEAHDRRGPTIPAGSTPKLAALREWRRAGDFEGHVTLGIGVADRVGFRVFELRNPNRLVIDLAHPLPAPTSAASRTLPAKASRPVHLVDVRTARHPGYDRAVFTFDGPAPGVRAAYVRQVMAGESGEPLPLEGRAALEVSFSPAAGHDDSGHPTWSGPRDRSPRLPALRQLRTALDVEGELRFGLGVDERAGYRLMRLSDPTRIVVDVAH